MFLFALHPVEGAIAGILVLVILSFMLGGSGGAGKKG